MIKILIVLLAGGMLLGGDSFGQQKKDTTYFSVAFNIWGDSLSMNTYADSVNNYSSGAIPAFLLDECFDFNHHEFWEGFHDPVCARYFILKRVNNKYALQILSKDKRLKVKCKHEPFGGYVGQVPMRELSTHDLIEIRIKEL
jgi:hypothetical protein